MISSSEMFMGGRNQREGGEKKKEKRVEFGLRDQAGA